MIIDRDLIQKAKEKLADENATIMAELLELSDYDEKNRKAVCCFHSEKTPSLIYNPKNYTLHCFGCQKTVDIIDCYMLTGMTYVDAVQKLFEIAKIKYSFGEHKVKTYHKYKYPSEVICLSKEAVYKYLSLRGISGKTVDYVDVRQDEHENCVFNYYDTNDVLATVKYRPSRKINKGSGEQKMWCQKDADTKPLLFNMNRININTPLLITEGEIDCMSAIESGYSNTVSVPFGAGNYTWIEENWDFLQQFDSIIICADNDDSGIKMQKEVIYRLGSWRTKIIDIPLTVISSSDGTEKHVSDLNEVLYYSGKEAVIDLILNAKDTPVEGVVDFSDINDIDVDQMDGITTGIKEIDRYLMKLFYGTLNIFTGINGSGKSSLINQIICQALDDNKNTFLYSGELPNFQSKNWINYIFAGQRNLKMYTNGDTNYWKVTSEAKQNISNYYKGRLYIHQDGYSNKKSDIFNLMENNARKYGVKLFILDNMTSMNLENTDANKLEKQAELVVGLINFAVKYNVTVILVVHPHKIDMMRRLSKMDVQGISAIIDLAHRIVSLYRVQEREKDGVVNQRGGYKVQPVKYDVICDILKDRMLGHEGKSVGLYYDYPSKRFFTCSEDLDYQYKWDTTTYNTPLPFPPPQLLNEDEVLGEIKQ